MARIYDVSESDRGKELMRAILYAARISTQGNMDAVLGRSLWPASAK